MQNFAYVIVGAGFAGAATAYHLARRGIGDVLVLGTRKYPRISCFRPQCRNAAPVCRRTRLDQAGARWRGIYSKPAEGLAGAGVIQATTARYCSAAAPAGRSSSATATSAAASASPTSPSGRRKKRFAMCRCSRKRSSTVRYGAPAMALSTFMRCLSGYLKFAASRGAQIRYNAVLRAVRRRPGADIELETADGVVSCKVLVNAGGAWANVVADLAGARASAIARMPAPSVRFAAAGLGRSPLAVCLGCHPRYLFSPRRRGAFALRLRPN